MSLRAVSIAGWICFALDALFVAGLLLSKNMGDDAAGRGLATAWGTILAAPLLVAGAVLLWGTVAGSRAGTIAGSLLSALPFIIMLANGGTGLVDKAGRAAWKAREGRFRDPAISALARAVERGDTARIRALLATERPRDFSERDAWGHTLLGYAATRAVETYAAPSRRAAVVALLEGGVPYTADAVKPGEDWVAGIVWSSGDAHNDLVRAALAAGADPNAKDPYDDDALLLTPNMTVAKLELLARHGADLQVRSKRTDRPGWSALMNAVYQQQWDVALFFLRHGVSPAYRAEDGKTVREVLAEITDASWASVDTTDARYHELREALGAARRAP